MDGSMILIALAFLAGALTVGSLKGGDARNVAASFFDLLRGKRPGPPVQAVPAIVLPDNGEAFYAARIESLNDKLPGLLEQRKAALGHAQGVVLAVQRRDEPLLCDLANVNHRRMVYARTIPIRIWDVPCTRFTDVNDPELPGPVEVSGSNGADPSDAPQWPRWTKRLHPDRR